jgi:hypothetical protein
MDFRQKKWRRRGDTNSLAVKMVTPRVSLIAGLSTNGQIYFSLTQANTDSNVMVMFLQKLSTLLASEDSDWRRTTALMFDSASYHRSQETRAYFERAGFQIILLGPYFYSGSPIELFFGYLKKGNLNSQGTPTGKK